MQFDENLQKHFFKKFALVYVILLNDISHCKSVVEQKALAINYCSWKKNELDMTQQTTLCTGSNLSLSVADRELNLQNILCCLLCHVQPILLSGTIANAIRSTPDLHTASLLTSEVSKS